MATRRNSVMTMHRLDCRPAANEDKQDVAKRAPFRASSAQ